jgi:dTDP-4-dehydrorhamnose reductase
MKLLLTGASGLVGAAVARCAASLGWAVTGVVGRWSGEIPGAKAVVAVDLSDIAVVKRLVREACPQVIVNAAAVAEPAACEAAPELSHRLNVELPEALALAAREIGARLIHLSSEQAFDGEQAPYSAGDATRPVNLYGRQKVDSENRVMAASPAAAVVRAPLLLGNSLGGRRSVHEKFLESWAAGKPVKLYRNEIRQVCTADNLAAVLVELARRSDLCGVFHWAGAEPISRWDLGRRIAAHLGFEEEWLQPMRRADTPEVSARRPRDLAFNLAPLDRELRTKPDSVAEAVASLRVPAWAEALVAAQKP